MSPYKRYTNAERKKLVLEYEASGLTSLKFSTLKNVRHSTFRSMLDRKDRIISTKCNGKDATLGGQGRRQKIPFASELHQFMLDVHHAEHFLTHTHMITFMKQHHMEWLESYLKSKKNDERAYHSLLRLCQRFTARYRFSQRVPCLTKVPREDLIETRDNFAAAFWDKFRDYADGDIINVDETSVYYDMPPSKTLAPIGGSSKVDTTQKHSDRITAVLSVRSNGEKLPILFILNGVPGGIIDRNEVPTYPEGHVYAVQEKAWMDTSVWAFYLSNNLDCHVSEASHETIATELFSVLEPLPKNCTSVCQPLDVGVMGPLKAKLRSKWLYEKPVVSAAEKRLAMIKRTIEVWEEMSTETVRRSFEKALPKILIL
ncbi:Aste57867_16416 [Aphanomyces stellatus]|uniref:Aste57867_16416 protein n=1 Tax=Aphanomyces stellatus TaxID=120398 RepID=A0A485L5D9_9STRA|nr:hypothetical protein As57867_016359 [Aphanomyces stellatus]VFT93191.1 Aste57867_16416 [Aphanomyces stellatus]